METERVQQQVRCPRDDVRQSAPHSSIDRAPPHNSSPSSNPLKSPDPLDLCLSCHDGNTFAPDVVLTDANGLVQRSAGYFATSMIKATCNSEQGVAKSIAQGATRGTTAAAHWNGGTGAGLSVPRLRWAGHPARRITLPAVSSTPTRTACCV